MISTPQTVVGKIRPIFAAIQTTAVPAGTGQIKPQAPPAVPFVTLSRQAGAGAWTLAQNLVEKLNAVDAAEQPWSAWDRELVEKVAADHHISQQLIESLEQSSRTWLGEFFGGLSFGASADNLSEDAVYHRVAASIRALAQVGRVVIVGRGGVHITRNMPGGIHIRLIAPLDYRVNFMMRQHGLGKEEAAVRIKQLDKSRETFYRKYWPDAVLAPDLFTVTLNTAQLSEEQMIECLLPLIPKGVRKE